MGLHRLPYIFLRRVLITVYVFTIIIIYRLTMLRLSPLRRFSWLHARLTFDLPCRRIDEVRLAPCIDLLRDAEELLGGLVKG